LRPQCTCDCAALPEWDNLFCDGEQLGQCLAPGLSLSASFVWTSARLTVRLPNPSGLWPLCPRRLCVEKRQHGGGIENVSTHATPRHVARRATVDERAAGLTIRAHQLLRRWMAAVLFRRSRRRTLAPAASRAALRTKLLTERCSRRALGDSFVLLRSSARLPALSDCWRTTAHVAICIHFADTSSRGPAIVTFRCLPDARSSLSCTPARYCARPQAPGAHRHDDPDVRKLAVQQPGQQVAHRSALGRVARGLAARSRGKR